MYAALFQKIWDGLSVAGKHTGSVVYDVRLGREKW